MTTGVRGLVAFLGVVVVACGGADADSNSATVGEAETPAGVVGVDTVDVFLQEYVIDMPGRLPERAVLRVVNSGSEPHNLKLARAGEDDVAWEMADLDPGAARIMPLELEPGPYDVTCDLAGHDLRGMITEVEVGPRRP